MGNQTVAKEELECLPGRLILSDGGWSGTGQNVGRNARWQGHPQTFLEKHQAWKSEDIPD